jgi:hypothetical protein
MAGFYPECNDYGNCENKVKRFRLWRRDGRAAAPIASGYRLASKFPDDGTSFTAEQISE